MKEKIKLIFSYIILITILILTYIINAKKLLLLIIPVIITILCNYLSAKNKIEVNTAINLATVSFAIIFVAYIKTIIVYYI